MFSFCSSIYRETVELDVFIRSLICNASDPNMLEIIITNDEGYTSTASILNRLQDEFPQVKSITISKEDRISFIKSCIDLYTKDSIFPEPDINIMIDTLSKYESGEIDRLWFPPARGYNLAAQASIGNILAIIPSDYVCFFDATEVYNRRNEILNEYGVIACNFGWIRLSDIPDKLLYNDTIDTLYKNIDADKRTSLNNMLNIALGMNLPTTSSCQHGSRVVSRNLFDDVGGFDDRWFLRAMYDEIFNTAIDNHSKIGGGTCRCGCCDKLGLNNVYLGEQKILKDETISNNYLLPNIYSNIKESNEYISKYLFTYLNNNK